jgi:hypothetical protein
MILVAGCNIILAAAADDDDDAAVGLIGTVPVYCKPAED